MGKDNLQLEIETLRDATIQSPSDASLWYELGRALWKAGSRGEAISAYCRSAELHPGGPGAIALEQAREIMDFYNKDLYNP